MEIIKYLLVHKQTNKKKNKEKKKLHYKDI